MSRFGLDVRRWTDSTEATTHIQLLGNPVSATAVLLLSIIGGVGTARYVAVTENYLAIQYALPTYDGSLGTWFYVGGAILLGLAVISAFLKAGLVPTVIVASTPVVGWAVNHFSSSITPHYSIIFPIEMALLYGGVFGIVGYLIGTVIRRGVQTAPEMLKE